MNQMAPPPAIPNPYLPADFDQLDIRGKAVWATEFLALYSAEMAASDANALTATRTLSKVKASEMRNSSEKSAAMKEADALSSLAYETAMKGEHEATKEARTFRHTANAAEKIIDVWRTLNANQRAAERGYGSAS